MTPADTKAANDAPEIVAPEAEPAAPPEATPGDQAPADPAVDPAPTVDIDVPRAIRVIATTLYGPNAGGDANRAEVEALFADIIAGE